jgi:hypothetical protein
MNNYELVLDVIKSYESERILNDFKSSFIEGENVKKKDYMMFCEKFIDDISEWYYIKLNWKYIKNGGDESVFDEVE